MIYYNFNYDVPTSTPQTRTSRGKYIYKRLIIIIFKMQRVNSMLLGGRWENAIQSQFRDTKKNNYTSIADLKRRIISCNRDTRGFK